MDTDDVSKAKTYLAALLGRVAKGEKITITRHGSPATLLVPVGDTALKLSHQEIVEGMQALRKRVKPASMSVKEMVNEGRHF